MARRGFTERMYDVLASWGLPVSTHASARTPAHRREELRLVLSSPAGRLLVGTLVDDSGEFVFRYSDEFKKQSTVPPLSAFPDKDEEYRSTHLWPFFEVRLPPRDRPDVQEALRKRNIDPSDTLRVLGEVARRPVSTPFEFEYGT